LDYEFEISDILKRLNAVENCLLGLTDVIDLAQNYDQELNLLKMECKKNRNLHKFLQQVANDLIDILE
jgi:hypothetical protein